MLQLSAPLFPPDPESIPHAAPKPYGIPFRDIVLVGVLIDGAVPPPLTNPSEWRVESPKVRMLFSDAWMISEWTSTAIISALTTSRTEYLPIACICCSASLRLCLDPLVSTEAELVSPPTTEAVVVVIVVVVVVEVPGVEISLRCTLATRLRSSISLSSSPISLLQEDEFADEEEDAPSFFFASRKTRFIRIRIPSSSFPHTTPRTTMSVSSAIRAFLRSRYFSIRATGSDFPGAAEVTLRSLPFPFLLKGVLGLLPPAPLPLRP
mmetsp:Transcript_27694/g.67373  ORF Transcript_27694/g.67373 Transcript_27694/m.67373 type:complete len:265 (-) Transcript_27694:229-1023(-)